jgi:hypothetical protein
MARGQDHFGDMGGAKASQHYGPGHNRAGGPSAVAQWQVPHLDKAADLFKTAVQGEPDLDKVEAAFSEGFAAATDPTSFLRLANVPFELTGWDGAPLVLLRVEIELVADVGGVTPHLGGETFRYDPLPTPLVTRRRRLRFVYLDGRTPRALSFSDVRALLAVAPRGGIER